MTKLNEVTKLEKEIIPLALQSFKVTIKSKEDLTEAVSTLSTVNRYNDTVIAEKEKLTTPLNLTLKNIRAMFKPLEERLESSISHLRGLISQYQTALIEEERKVSERIKPGRGNLSLETGVKKLEEIGRTDEVATDAGVVEFREMKKFEVIDVTLLPHEYILPNETAIRIAMRNGVELPGVHYFTEQIPVNTR